MCYVLSVLDDKRVTRTIFEGRIMENWPASQTVWLSRLRINDEESLYSTYAQIPFNGLFLGLRHNLNNLESNLVQFLKNEDSVEIFYSLKEINKVNVKIYTIHLMLDIRVTIKIFKDYINNKMINIDNANRHVSMYRYIWL